MEGKRGRRLVGGLILVGGALLAMPMANLPLNNFFPALMIFFAALAWIERDGLMVILSLAWGGIDDFVFRRRRSRSLVFRREGCRLDDACGDGCILRKMKQSCSAPDELKNRDKAAAPVYQSAVTISFAKHG